MKQDKNNYIRSVLAQQGCKYKFLDEIFGEIARTWPAGEASGWIEPFAGSGTVAINRPVKGRCVIGDSNRHSVEMLRLIRDGFVTGEELLNRFGEEDPTPEYYYYVRDRFNSISGDSMDLMWLLRHGFNGLMRFNKSGAFNTPFGRHRSRVRQMADEVGPMAAALSGAKILHSDFEGVIGMAGPGDVIYLDPPYLATCSRYANDWTIEDEERLARCLDETPAAWVMSNHAGNPELDRLWSGYDIRSIGKKNSFISNRAAGEEILISRPAKGLGYISE
jgi:DNA adenine methylase